MEGGMEGVWRGMDIFQNYTSEVQTLLFSKNLRYENFVSVALKSKTIENGSQGSKGFLNSGQSC